MKDAREMQVEDRVEFLSDLQTEKGPSTGRLLEKVGDYLVIKHSDHPRRKLRCRNIASDHFYRT